ncbi:MAG: (Na+)-NQR maturation NqrM [Bacteriovoracaceae bacterium]|nr:(Na+)-NQR maturation NqrM [Bacteriovoracaceae bacterium]
MKIFLITFVFFSTTIFLMAIGYIIARKKLKGSCGGLGKIMGDDCMFCSKKNECEKNTELQEECIGDVKS